MKENKPQEISVVFHGLVQGVGFRYTALDLANKNNVLGWVRNNPDGTVEIRAQGKKEDLDNFLEQLQGVFKQNLSKVNIQKTNYSGKYFDFNIRYS